MLSAEFYYGVLVIGKLSKVVQYSFQLSWVCGKNILEHRGCSLQFTLYPPLQLWFQAWHMASRDVLKHLSETQLDLHNVKTKRSCPAP